MSESTSTVSTPAAPLGVGPSAAPKVVEPGQKKGSLIDSSSQSTLAEKVARGDAPAPKKEEPAKTEAAPEKKDEAPAGKPGTEEEKKPTTPQKFKVKVDGKEQEVSLEELTRGFQRGAGAEKKIKEASELEKKLQQVLKVIQSDTGEALKAAGLTDEQIETFAIKLIADRQKAYLEQERLKQAPPEEREMHELREKVRQFEAKEQARQQEEQQRAVQQRHYQISQYTIAMLEALPQAYRKDDFVASRALDAAQYVFENYQKMHEQGVDYTPKAVAKRLQTELEGLAKKLGVSPAEAAAAVAGSEPETKPGATPVSRKQEAKKQPQEKERLTQAQLIRQITLGER